MVHIGVDQARLIALSLQKYERLKPAYVELKRGSLAKDVALTQYKISLTAKDSIISSYARSEIIQFTLRKDAETRASQWQAKAKRRGWVVAGLTVLLGAVTYTAIAR